MELCYYKDEEENKYKTWHFIKRDVVVNGELVASYNEGWVKKQKPNFIENSQEAIDWYNISNEEDLHFIIKEREAFMKWCFKNLDEITNAVKYNKKLSSL